MTLTWTDLTNGISNLLFRGNINTFNNNVVTQVNQNTTDIGTNYAAIISNDSDIAALDGRVTVNEGDITNLDGRITSIEDGHINIISASSTVDQNPTGLGDANKIQLVFDSNVSVTDVSITTAGTVTFNTTGKYYVRFEAHYGRTGSTGASLLVFRSKINGIVSGSIYSAKVDNADIIIPWSDTNILSVTSGDILTMELLRDSSGDNSGGLTAVSTDWGQVSSCKITIYKI